jgi:hypothetical protein
MPSVPEYNALPLDSAGDVTLKVRFADKADAGRSLPSHKMRWSDLAYFFDEATQAPHPQLYCDDYLLPVKAIEILPAGKTVVIVVGATGLEPLH